MDIRSVHPRTLRLLIENGKDERIKSQARAEQARRERVPGYIDAHAGRRKLKTGMLEARRPVTPPRVAEFHKPNPPASRPSAKCRNAWDALREQHPEVAARIP